MKAAISNKRIFTALFLVAIIGLLVSPVEATEMKGTIFHYSIRNGEATLKEASNERGCARGRENGSSPGPDALNGLITAAPSMNDGGMAGSLAPAFANIIRAGAADYYVRDYGAVGDGATNDKTHIQSAIDDAAAHGGGNVIFDQSRAYSTGNLYLKSGVTLVIESGSKILASRYWWDYDHNNSSDDGNGNCECSQIAPLIFADNQHNIGIRGDGSIEGNRGIYGSKDKRCDSGCCSEGGPALVFFGDVSYGTIEDITITKNGDASVVIAESDHIVLDNVTIHAPTEHQCNDSLDIFGSQHVTVRNCDIEGGDDNIALKVQSNIYGGAHMMTSLDPDNLEPVADNTIENNTVYAPNGGSGLQIGWSLKGGCFNVIYRNNIIRKGTNTPIGIWVRFIEEGKTSIHDIEYIDNRYDSGELVEDLKINSPQFDCQYYDIFWNGSLVDKYVQTGAECGGNCTCAAWVDQGCGQGLCSADNMNQTRTCDPLGCDSETRCVADPACSSAYEKEDINQDGEINLVDVMLCVNVFLEIETNSGIVERADVNQDGKVDALDVQQVIRRAY